MSSRGPMIWARNTDHSRVKILYAWMDWPVSNTLPTLWNPAQIQVAARPKRERKLMMSNTRVVRLDCGFSSTASASIEVSSMSLSSATIVDCAFVISTKLIYSLVALANM